jgi:hypothetical protein
MTALASGLTGATGIACEETENPADAIPATNTAAISFFISHLCALLRET